MKPPSDAGGHAGIGARIVNPYSPEIQVPCATPLLL
jgi:hypothetical protein